MLELIESYVRLEKFILIHSKPEDVSSLQTAQGALLFQINSELGQPQDLGEALKSQGLNKKSVEAFLELVTGMTD